MNRLVLALVAYGVLGVLSWATLADRRIRLVTLAVLAMFVVRTLVHRKRTLHADDSEGEH